MSGWLNSGFWPFSVFPTIGIRSSAGIGTVGVAPSRGSVVENCDW